MRKLRGSNANGKTCHLIFRTLQNKLQRNCIKNALKMYLTKRAGGVECGMLGDIVGESERDSEKGMLTK